jgi:hypothetical protein
MTEPIKGPSLCHKFQARIPTLAPESEQLVHDLFTSDGALEIDFLEGKTAGPTVFPASHFKRLWRALLCERHSYPKVAGSKSYQA